MIRFTIVNRSKTRTVLLIHGLFTSSGYWLPYLPILKEYRLIVLDVDYRTIRDTEPYVNRVAEIITSEAGGKVDAVISHSLGSLIANQLPENTRQSSFEVCPVYSATRLNPERFVREIERKLNFAMSSDEIKALLQDVDYAIAACRSCNKLRRTQSTYLPSTDSYFSYYPEAASKEFHGDHFEIAEAVADIRRTLS